MKSFLMVFEILVAMIRRSVTVTLLLLCITSTGCKTLTELGGIKSTNKAGNNSAIELLQSANTAYQAGQWSVAERLYLELTREVERDPYAYFQVGNTLMKQYRYAEAVNFYQKALELNPDMLQADNNRATAHMLLAESILRNMLESTQINANYNPEAHASIKKKLTLLREASSVPLQQVRSPIR